MSLLNRTAMLVTTPPTRPTTRPKKGLTRAMLALLAVVSAPAFAASATSPASASASYQHERDRCNSAPASQDRASCLREAGAVLAESRRGIAPPVADYAANQVRRCDRLPDADRQACVARMQGQGTTSGSVGGGGIYRELVTTETAPAASPAK